MRWFDSGRGHLSISGIGSLFAGIYCELASIVLSALIRCDPPMCAGDCPKTVLNGGSLEAAMAQLAGIQVRHRTTCATRSGWKVQLQAGLPGERLERSRGQAPEEDVPEAGDVTLPVSAAAGTILHFICGLHPWMQARSS